MRYTVCFLLSKNRLLFILSLYDAIRVHLQCNYILCSRGVTKMRMLQLLTSFAIVVPRGVKGKSNVCARLLSTSFSAVHKIFFCSRPCGMKYINSPDSQIRTQITPAKIIQKNPELEIPVI